MRTGGRRPRISVVVDDQVADTLRRVAVVEGRSVSAVVAELLGELEPGLRNVAVLGEALRRTEGAQRDALRRAVAAADEQVGAPLVRAVDDARRGLEALGSIAAGADSVALEQAPAGADLTPLGNTGVTPS